MAQPPESVRIPAEFREAIAHCFACGPKNPHGLRLEARQEGGKTVLDFQGSQALAGYDTVYHGGILATLLDEVAGFALFDGWLGFGMTRKLSVEYKRRVHWTRPLRAEATLAHRDAERAVFHCEILQDGRVCTVAEVEFALIPPPPRGA